MKLYYEFSAGSESYKVQSNKMFELGKVILNLMAATDLKNVWDRVVFLLTTGHKV